MNSVKDVLEEELKYVLDLKKHYQENIEQLPKGSISKKIISGKEYLYLQYRAGRKVFCNFLKMSVADLKYLKEKIQKREKYKKLLKEVEQKIMYLRKLSNVRLYRAS